MPTVKAANESPAIRPPPTREVVLISDGSSAATVVAHAAFVPTGIVTVLLGPVLPTLAARWSMNESRFHLASEMV